MCICDQAPVAKGLGGTPSGAIQHAVGVRGPIGASAVYLESQPVVIHAGHGPPDGSDPYQFPITIHQPETKFNPGRWFVVTVMLCDERACLAECDRNQVQIGHDGTCPEPPQY